MIAAGGARYFSCLWVTLTVLRRHLHCTLPVQIWYRGSNEMSAPMLRLLERFDVECVDAEPGQLAMLGRTLGGHELKPWSILHSRFRHVIYLDADNVPLVDPATFLDGAEYARTGAVFWPNIYALEPSNPIWGICRIPYRAEPAFETGQLLIDKQRCWHALHLTTHLNERSEFYYLYLCGDCNTFYVSWRMLDRPYAMPQTRPTKRTDYYAPDDPFPNTALDQHDFSGTVAFHHRTGGTKWNAWGRNVPVAPPAWHSVIDDALADLRLHWDGHVQPLPSPVTDEAFAETAVPVAVHYCRVGSDERLLELLPDGSIGQGCAASERRWHLEEMTEGAVLVISGDYGDICRVSRHSDGVWRGQWTKFERMPIEIVPLA